MARSSSRRLTKRAFDTRLFSVDVSAKLRTGDTVITFDDVVAMAQTETPEGVEADIPFSVQVPGDDVTLPDGVTRAMPVADGKILNFYCAGGAPGVTYDVMLQYTTSSEPRLESLIHVAVI